MQQDISDSSLRDIRNAALTTWFIMVGWKEEKQKHLHSEHSFFFSMFKTSIYPDFHSFRASWTPCRPSSTRWPFTAGPAWMLTSVCSGPGSCPGTPALPQCRTQPARTQWWGRLCSTRVMFRRPRKAWWEMDSTTRMPSVFFQKVIGSPVALTALPCIRAGDASTRHHSWEHVQTWSMHFLSDTSKMQYYTLNN